MRRTNRLLTDRHWERIAPFFPKHPPSPKGGRPRASDRECLEGILWLARTGARWRDIPLDLPSGSTCWRRLAEWAGEGVLAEIHAILIEQLDDLGRLDFDELLADATFIRAKKGGSRLARPRLARV
jgi:transposase